MAEQTWGNVHGASGKDEWLTPPHVTGALGAFDLDPCAPSNPLYRVATKFYSERGLRQPWEGRVWMNPPYGTQTGHWMRRLAEHGNGIALIFARTETKMFFDYVWSRASAILFLRGRLTFHHADGTKPRFNAGAPSCLVAYGDLNASILQSCGLDGKFVRL